MTVVLLLWRTRLRSSWRSAVILVVLIGLGGAVTLAVAAGARRTASANNAILQAANASDITTTFGSTDPVEVQNDIKALPEVSAVEVWIGFRGRAEGVDPASILSILGFRSDHPAVDRPIITSGRFPTGADEVFLNELAAARSGLRVGSRLRLALADTSFQDFEPVEVVVAGIGLLPEEVIQDESEGSTVLWFSPALTERHLDRQQFGLVRLTLASEDLAPVNAGLLQRGLAVEEIRAEDSARVQRSLQPLLWALAGLAVLAGAATVLVTAQALARILRRSRDDDRSLAALGCTTRQLVAADLAYAATVAGCGIGLAVSGAVAASPLFPLGPPRRVAAIGGFDADLVALGAGGLALATVILVLVATGSWRQRTSTGSSTPGRAPGLLGARPATATGLRLLTGRRGTTSMIAGAAASLAAVVTTLSFTGSLDHLVRHPALSGMGWDLAAREGFTVVDVAPVRDALAHEPTVLRLSGLGLIDGELNGAQAAVAQVKFLRGDPWPPIVAGRAPTSTSEILVGRATLRALNLSIGDEVSLQLAPSFNDLVSEDETGPPPKSGSFTIVGSAVTPAIGAGGFDPPRLDVGVLLHDGAFEAVLGLPLHTDVIFFDLASDGDAAAIKARFPDGLPDRFDAPTEWLTSARPAEISQAEDARTVIWLGAAALAVAVVATIAHTLLGFVRQRRRDYAVLKALGFTRAQIRTTILTQSGAILAVALVVALPLGAAAGRWLWTAFAEHIGVVVDPVVPSLLLSAAVLLSVLAVQGAALIPASLASRTPAGRTLHGE